MKLLYIPNKNELELYLFRTCKPTGNPIFKFPICLTGQGNKKSLPFVQFEVVECGLDEFCEPYPPGPYPLSGDVLPIEFGYVFLIYDPLLITKTSLSGD